MRKLVRAVLLLVLLLVGVLVAALLFIDMLARTGIEKGATYALGVEAKAKGVSLDLFDGQLVIGELFLANPEGGYTSPHLMQMGRFDLVVKPKSVFGEPVVIKTFILDGLDLNIEQAMLSNNVATVLTNVRRLISDKPRKDGKKIQVDRIVIRNVVAHIRFTGSDLLGQTRTVKLPEIQLSNVTSDNPGGAAVSELTARIFPALLAAVLERSEDVAGVDADKLARIFGDLTDLLGGVDITVPPEPTGGD